MRFFSQRRHFNDLSEQEVIALAISSEEDDARIYRSYAEMLRAAARPAAEATRRGLGASCGVARCRRGIGEERGGALRLPGGERASRDARAVAEFGDLGRDPLPAQGWRMQCIADLLPCIALGGAFELIGLETTPERLSTFAAQVPDSRIKLSAIILRLDLRQAALDPR